MRGVNMYKNSAELKEKYGISNDILKNLEVDGVKTRKNGIKKEYDVEDIFHLFDERRKKVLSNFNLNEEYSNVYISNAFGANVQRGMKKSNYYHSLVLLHTKSGRVEYDDFWDNEILHYTGMGVDGNQKLLRENKTLANSNDFRLAVYLFESTDNSNNYKFLGQVRLCANPYIHTEIDSTGNNRSVYKFPLKIIETNAIDENQIENDISLETDTEFFVTNEGKKIAYFTTKYERNPKLRKQAIQIHGTKCMVCGFDFEKKYGELGKDYIEVHHIKPLFLSEGEQQVNPETDLVCLCSNCHRMIHRKRNNVIAVDDLRKLVNQSESKSLIQKEEDYGI